MTNDKRINRKKIIEVIKELSERHLYYDDWHGIDKHSWMGETITERQYNEISKIIRSIK